MANENETVAEVCREISCSHEGMIGIELGCFAARIHAAHKREIDELKKQVSIAKDAFFKIVQCGHSQAVHDIVCEAEFMIKHPECRKEVLNGK